MGVMPFKPLLGSGLATAVANWISPRLEPPMVATWPSLQSWAIIQSMTVFTSFRFSMLAKLSWVP